MDFLTFVSKTFDAWAWPLTVLAMVGWFRDELKAILLNIESFKAGGIEATVNRKIKAASEIADDLPPANGPEVAPPEFEDAALQPEYTIIEAWKELEHFTNEYVALRGVRSETTRRKRIASTNELVAAGFTKAEADLYRELLQVRNLVVHEREPKVSAAQAKEYFELAYRLIGLIRVKTDIELERRAAA